MESLRERQRAFREQEIVKTAAALIAEHGCRRMTMDEVARQLGISKATLYDHFAGKDALIAAALARGAEAIGPRIREIASEGDGSVDALRRVASEIMRAEIGVGEDTRELCCCCLGEVTCGYDGWSGVEELLDGMVADTPFGGERSLPFATALRSLSAAVLSSCRAQDRAPTESDVEDAIAYLFGAA